MTVYDCHMHAFDDHFSTSANAKRIPAAPVAQYMELREALGVSKSVIVAPSFHGYDNSPTLASLRKMGNSARAVLNLSPDVDEAQIAQLHTCGVRGARLNLMMSGKASIEAAMPLAARVRAMGWHLQLTALPEHMLEYESLIAGIDVPIVLDHMAGMPRAGGTGTKAYAALCRQLDRGSCWVKLSLGSMFGSIGIAEESPILEMGKHLSTNFPERVVWGSDWPHVSSHLEGSPLPHMQDLLALVDRWTNSASEQRRILELNPRALYGF